jgi:hypothetical protein
MKEVLRRMNEIMRTEVTQGWRKLHIEQLRDLCPSPNVILVVTP